MPAGLNWEFGYETLGLYPMLLSLSRFEQCTVVADPASNEVLIYEFEIYVCRQVLFVGCGWFFNLHKQSACSGEQPANWSAGCAKSPTFGSRTYLQLWIDGKKVANIGPGHRYDESIPAGHHVLAVNYTPRTRHQPTSLQLTVRKGETYAFTAIRESDQGVSFRQSNRTPP